MRLWSIACKSVSEPFLRPKHSAQAGGEDCPTRLRRTKVVGEPRRPGLEETSTAGPRRDPGCRKLSDQIVEHRGLSGFESQFDQGRGGRAGHCRSSCEQHARGGGDEGVGGCRGVGVGGGGGGGGTGGGGGGRERGPPARAARSLRDGHARMMALELYTSLRPDAPLRGERFSSRGPSATTRAWNTRLLERNATANLNARARTEQALGGR